MGIQPTSPSLRRGKWDGMYFSRNALITSLRFQKGTIGLSLPSAIIILENNPNRFHVAVRLCSTCNGSQMT